jgi:hypothetical protein
MVLVQASGILLCIIYHFMSLLLGRDYWDTIVICGNGSLFEHI